MATRNDSRSVALTPRNLLKGSELKKQQLARNLEKHGETIRRLYVEDGRSQASIADEIGVSQASVGHWMQALGIPARPSWRSGPDNPNYKDGTESRAYRKLVSETACASCGATQDLLVHHDDGNHFNNEVGNLVVMCSPCHSRHHKTLYWQSQPKKTHCLNGHPLAGDNLYVNPGGHRSCKQCRREASRRHEGYPKPQKTHCLRGHALSGENLYVSKNGYRSCMECRREAAKKCRFRRRDAGQQCS